MEEVQDAIDELRILKTRLGRLSQPQIIERIENIIKILKKEE